MYWKVVEEDKRTWHEDWGPNLVMLVVSLLMVDLVMVVRTRHQLERV